MHEIRLHGRGGQGVVTAAELLSVAAFTDGRHAQAFPSFGSERTGAPVAAFCRISDEPIRLREPIVHPDVVAVLDPTLLHSVDLFAGIAPHALVLVNSSRSADTLGLGELPARVHCVAATELARRLVGKPLPNAAILGALAAIVDFVHLDAICAAIRARFSGAVGEKNVAAARAAYEQLRPVEGARC
jgi:pyruvate ferredoxin oxidoreductase gamma subunit